MAKAKATNEQLAAAYADTPNVWRVAERFGMCGQSVHERLAKIGVINPMRRLSDEERLILIERYVEHANAGTLAALAREMGRTKHYLCRHAGFLGMTDPSRIGTWPRDLFTRRAVQPEAQV